MNQKGSDVLKKLQQKSVSRRNLFRAAAGAALGTGIVVPKPAYAWQEEEKRCKAPRLKPIPGGVVPFKPFGVPVHHNPLIPRLRWQTLAIHRRLVTSMGWWV